VAAVLFVMLFQVYSQHWVWVGRRLFLSATFWFTILSGLHYVYLVGQRLHTMNQSTAHT
jgi:hypothetical protein